MILQQFPARNELTAPLYREDNFRSPFFVLGAEWRVNFVWYIIVNLMKFYKILTNKNFKPLQPTVASICHCVELAHGNGKQLNSEANLFVEKSPTTFEIKCI